MHTLYFQGVDRVLESFLVLTDDERLQLQKKRASKQRKRQRAAGEDDSLTTADKLQLSVEDQHRRHEPVRVPQAKLCCLDVLCNSAGVCQVSKNVRVVISAYLRLNCGCVCQMRWKPSVNVGSHRSKYFCIIY